jgi:hypothetical protein
MPQTKGPSPVSQIRTKIGVVAPASRIDPEIAEDVKALAADQIGRASCRERV